MNVSGILVIIILFALFWLLLIRPQRRRMQAQRDLIAALRVGDEVVTAGGLMGEITALDTDEVRLEIADGVEVRVARRAIAAVVPGDEAEDDEPEDDQPEPPDRERSG